MKLKLLLAVMLILNIAPGCSKSDERPPNGEGYIFEITKDRILVLDNMEEQFIGKQWRDISNEYQGNAIWLHTNKTNLKIGQFIKYWITTGIDASFPAQATAQKIKIIE